MKKIIPFTKDIKFNTKIYEISSISLENTLVVEENGEIDGEFIISGDYKINDSSINCEPFIYSLPFDISLDDSYDTDTLRVDIDDFKYEIVNEEILKINIDVLVEGNIKIDLQEEEEVEEKEEIIPDVIIDAREEDVIENEESNIDKEDLIKEINRGDENMEMDLFKEEENEAVKVFKDDEKKENVTSIFESFDSKDEKYVSYYVHIVRDNDNLDSIASKYNVSIDDLKEYNNIDQITLGNKIIIPTRNNETI